MVALALRLLYNCGWEYNCGLPSAGSGGVAGGLLSAGSGGVAGGLLGASRCSCDFQGAPREVVKHWNLQAHQKGRFCKKVLCSFPCETLYRQNTVEGDKKTA